MPRIRDNIRDCAAYFYPSRAAAEAGISPIGSGFLIGIRSKTDESLCYPYVATNHSVVAAGGLVVRFNNKAGETDIVELTGDDWVFHPDGDDVAIAGVSLSSDYLGYMLISDYPTFLSRENMEEARIGLGDELFTVGKLIDQDGRQFNAPMVRFGQLSMMPGVPLAMEGGQKHECFLADLEPIGGLTGSPVFVAVHQLRLANPVEFNHAWSPFLLGINCGPLLSPQRMLHATASRRNQPFRTLASHPLMMVVPAWSLAETLNLPRFLDYRLAEDERRAASGTARHRAYRY